MEGKINTVEKGKDAESFAASWLEKRGLVVLERNWRCHHLEIDIIAEGPMLSAQTSLPVNNPQRFLHIVEVRSRADNSLVEPDLTVDDKKQKFLINAADAYIRSHRIHLETIFDIIGIRTSDTGESISFRPDAFHPGW
ncbi:MAG: YraN family protein [Bacteroidales bacterium]|nr:YraN family protein [Bacteroidales bacterium]